MGDNSPAPDHPEQHRFQINATVSPTTHLNFTAGNPADSIAIEIIFRHSIAGTFRSLDGSASVIFKFIALCGASRKHFNGVVTSVPADDLIRLSGYQPGAGGAAFRELEKIGAIRRVRRSKREPFIYEVPMPDRPRGPDLMFLSHLHKKRRPFETTDGLFGEIEDEIRSEHFDSSARAGERLSARAGEGLDSSARAGEGLSARAGEGLDSSARAGEGLSARAGEGLDSSARAGEGLSARAGEGLDSSARAGEGLSARAGEGLDSSARAGEGLDSSARAGEGLSARAGEGLDSTTPSIRTRAPACVRASSSSSSSEEEEEEEDRRRAMAIAAELAAIPSLPKSVVDEILLMEDLDLRLLVAARLDCEQNKKRTGNFHIGLFRSCLANPSKINADCFDKADRLLDPSKGVPVAPSGRLIEMHAEIEFEKRVDQKLAALSTEQLADLRRQAIDLAMTSTAKKALQESDPRRHPMVRMIVRGELKKQATQRSNATANRGNISPAG